MCYFGAMANRVIYVRKSDETFWARAEQRAADQRVSLSEYVSRLIRKDIVPIGAPKIVTNGDLADTLDPVVEELRKRDETGAN